ncbi:MAG: hypothetical protein WAW27_07730, partial [Chitinophagaceae bacterium]
MNYFNRIFRGWKFRLLLEEVHQYVNTHPLSLDFAGKTILSGAKIYFKKLAYFIMKRPRFLAGSDFFKRLSFL